MSIRKVILLLSVLVSIKASSQNDAWSGSTGTGSNLAYSGPNLLPPSPEAFNFTKYGNLPVGLFTGTAQYSIPIYTINSGSLQHAISLDYATNGVKVDEISSRVGMDWTLRAGGTITRTVEGLPDEFSSRTFYHGTPTTDDNFWTYVRQANQGTPPDFQPDEYSFNVNGLSGKFIKREDGSFKILSANGIKIEQDNSLNFTLTATDGTKYYFTYKEKTKALTNIGPTAPVNEPGYTITAWYLSKMISQEKDSIQFNYTAFTDTIKYANGISQENSTYIPIDYTYRTPNLNELSNGGSGSIVLGPACLDGSCVYLTTTAQVTGSLGFYLSSITFNNGQVDFITSSRDDVTGERKIDSIKVYRTSDNALIKCLALGYVYSYYSGSTYASSGTTTESRKRLFLQEFREVSKNLDTSNKYSFTYDDMDGLPPRLSFAQDKFGYFNGKVNSVFYPNDTWVDAFWGGAHTGADRSYDFNYAKKGVLTRISYPTGGYSFIQYEPHKVKNLVVYQTHVDSIVTKIDTSTISNQNDYFYTDTFQIGTTYRQLRLDVKCDWASTPAEYFPEAYQAVFSVIRVSDNTCVYACNRQVQPGQEYNDYQLAENLAGYGTGAYKVQFYASEARLRIKVRVDKITQTIDTSANVGIAGIRVKAVSDYADIGKEINRKEFLYGEWTDSTLQSTSGQGIIVDPTNRNFVSVARRFADNIRSGAATPDTKWYAGNVILHSNSVRNIYYNDNGSVVYSKVIELNHTANNINNGGTEYEFTAEEKTSALPLSNNVLTYVWSFSPFQAEGFPLNNNDFQNGLLKSTKTFTYQNKYGNRTILKESYNYYSLDSQYLSVDTFYLVREVLKRDGYVTAWQYFADFDINQYFRYYNWVKLDSTVEKINANSVTLTNKTAYSYSNYNYKVSQETSTGSDNIVKNVYKTYPNDNYSSYSGMVSRNIIDAEIGESVYKNSDQINRKETQFALNMFTDNSLYLPSVLQSSINGLSLQTDVTFDQYDEKGHPLQYTARDGLVTAIIWGYDSTYPVAKVVGASYSSAIALLNQFTLNSPSSDAALRIELNNLRTGLTGQVLVTTLTYSPLIGLTSQTDPKGYTTFYEYDDFNRLSLIRDKDNNIIKKYSYQFDNRILPECSGLDKKVIDGSCETGTWVCTSSVYQSGTQWLNTYHYEWSDGSRSPDYTALDFGCLL